jgi:hypothetical protein
MDLPGLPKKSIHHGDTEFAEGLFKIISSFDFLRDLSASAVSWIEI